MTNPEVAAYRNGGFGRQNAAGATTPLPSLIRLRGLTRPVYSPPPYEEGTMGLWNVYPPDLRIDDEVHVTVMGGQEFLTVLAVEPGDGETRVRLQWGWHIPREPFWDTLPNRERLTVRR